jgi:von Willebrand factor type A domain
VILLVGRSRSVGPGGLSAERGLARGLVEALPPSVRFNAILFGRQATPAFVLPRLATREALDVFTAAADPNRLENGTDVAAALARARTMLDTDRGEGRVRTWLVLMTDGSLPAKQNFEGMWKALAGADDRSVKVLVLFVRQHGDDEVPQGAVTEYVQFAEKFGGVVYAVPPGNVADTARGILDLMAKGGDLLNVRLGSHKMADVVPPGQGARVAFADVTKLSPQGRVRFSARGLDQEFHSDATARA